jgi:hypothetical protein
MKKISLYLDEQLWHRFRIECVKRKTSASQEVAGLIEQQLHQWQLEDEKHVAPSGGDGAKPVGRPSQGTDTRQSAGRLSSSAIAAHS